MNSFFSMTTHWSLPQTALTDSFEEMSIDGRQGNEGIVLWLGRDDASMAEVTHLVKLRGPMIRKKPDQIHIDAALFNDVADLAIKYKVRLLGQIHSHGPDYPLDLSETDRTYGLQVPYYLSLVAPDYGMSRVPITSCGVHIFIPDMGYVRLKSSVLSEAITITDGAHLPFLEAGVSL